MEIAWTIIGIVVPVLIGVGLSMIGLNPPEFKIARGCFWVSAIMLGGMNSVWDIKTDLPAWWRILAGALIWILIGVGLPEGLRWVTRRERREVPPKTTDEKPPSLATTKPETRPTLLELFKNDFPYVLKSTSDETGIRWKDGTVLNIKRQIYLDFPAKTQFLAFYIPASILPANNNRSFDACMILVDAVKPAIEGLPHKIHIKGGDAGGMTSMEELVFSGRVFIYHEDSLSNKQKAAIVNAYDARHYDVQLRGPDYLTPHLISWHHQHDAKADH